MSIKYKHFDDIEKIIAKIYNLVFARVISSYTCNKNGILCADKHSCTKVFTENKCK